MNDYSLNLCLFIKTSLFETLYHSLTIFPYVYIACAAHRGMVKIPAKYDRSVVMRVFARPVGNLMIPLFMKLGITGNQLSIFNIFFTLFSFLLIGTDSLVIGALLLQFTIIFDTMDGTLSKMRKQKSLYGRYLEKIWHNAIVPFLFVALGCNVTLNNGDSMYCLIGFFITGSILVVNLIEFIRRYTFQVAPKALDADQTVKSEKSLLQIVVRAIGDTSYIFMYVLVFGYAGYLDMLVLFYGVFYGLLFVVKFFQFLGKPKGF